MFKTVSRIRRYWILLLAAIVFVVAFYYAFRYCRRVLKVPSTEAVLMALGAAAANFEMYTLADRKKGNSFSAVIQRLGAAQPFIPFMYGMTGKHLFGGNPVTREAYEAGYIAGDHWPLLDKDEMETAKTAVEATTQTKATS